MEFYEVIERRKTIREFSEKKVEKEKIFKILKTGFRAPSYNHRREWNFVLLKDYDTRIKIVEGEEISGKISPSSLKIMLFEEDHLMADMYLDAIPKQKSMLLTAPELMAVVYKPKTKIEKSQRIYDLNCLASVWCCIENILLSMTYEGLSGSIYIPQKTEKMKELLKIPDCFEVAALIPFGYKAENAKEVKQKEIFFERNVYIDKWNN